MTIYGRTLREAAGEFVHELNSLLSKTLTHTPLQSFIVEQSIDGERVELASVSFPRQRNSTIELKTRYGPMDLYIAQTLDAVPDADRRQLRLRTVSYVYTLQPHTWEDRIIRWEYVRFPGDDAFWSRHHVQGLLAFQILDDRGRNHEVTLNDWHLPTGRVLIEDVIRFCLHDLEVPAHSTQEAWDSVLTESSSAFQHRR